MGASTKARTSAGSSRPRQTATPRDPIRVRLRRVGHYLAATFAHLGGASRLRREAVGLGLLLAAILTALVLGRGGDEGELVDWWGRALRASWGEAAPLIPILTGLAAIRALGGQVGPVLETRHLLGGAAFGVAVVGLLQLGPGITQPTIGGYLGLATATLAQRLLGMWGAGFALFLLGVVAIFLLAGTDLQTFGRDVWALSRLIWRGLRAIVAVIVAACFIGQELVATITRGRRSLPPAVSTLDEPLIERPPKREAPDSRAINAAARMATAPPSPPVINVPIAAPTPDERRTSRTALVATVQPTLPFPNINQLTNYDGVAPDQADLHAKARRIEATLASFKVEARVREINPGPAVTQYALEPGVGIKVRRITELQHDLALALAAPSIRIEAPIPGQPRVGLEIPNAQIETVGLRETLESASFTRGKAKLPIPLGRDVNGRYVVGDLTKMPHLLIAGATGSGKSVCLNAIISTFLLTRAPDDLKLIMIDPKMVELTGYNGVPHLKCPVVTEMDKVVGALRLTLGEMQRRYDLFARLGVRNLDGYRMKMADEPGAENLPYLIVIIDELADLMMTTPDEVETLLVRLAQMARATGIHLIIATQRPTVDVLTGLIKANVPARIAFAVSSLTDSRVILDLPGAERLLGRGDMLYLPPEAPKPLRIQGAFIEDKDAQYVVEHWHRVAPIPRYDPEWLELPGSHGPEAEEGGDDPLFKQALGIVQQQGTASTSMLQRRLRIGYNRAARLIEQMEDDGIIGPADGLRGRTVLVGEE